MAAGLDTLLQTTTETHPRPDQVFVTYDTKEGRVVKAGNFLERMLSGRGRIRTYALLIDTWVAIYDVDEVLRIFTTKEEAKIHLRLRIMAPSKNSTRIVEALIEPVRSPSEVLLAIVADAIRTLSDETQREGPDSLQRRIARDRTNWQNRIQQSISDRVGLTAELIFELGELDSERPEISVRHIDVRTKDAPHRTVPVTIHVVLEPTLEKAHDPLPSSDRERESHLRNVITSIFRDEVMLFDYWFNRQKVESILQIAVDKAYRTMAYRAVQVQMEPVSPPLPREEKVASTVTWKGKAERQIDFYVEAVLALQPNGAGLFDSLHLPSRQDWLTVEARRALEIAMHGRDFWDLALADQREVSSKVQTILRDAAGVTGQNVEPIVANVVLPEIRWLDKQHLEISGETFKTKNDLGTAEFDIILSLQFRTIRPLIEYVRHQHGHIQNASNYNAEIEAGLIDIIRKTVISVMSQVDHREYFASWAEWDGVPEEVRGAPPAAGYVYDRLVRAITQELNSRFSPELCEVRLRRVDRAVGEIWRHINDLAPFEITTQIMPRQMVSMAQVVPVKVRYRPAELKTNRVSELVAFGRDHLRREEIERLLEGATRQFLLGLDLAEIWGLGKGLSAGPGAGLDQNMLQAHLETYVSQRMVETFGFSVHVESAEVAFTSEQKAAFETAELGTIAQQTLADFRRGQIKADFDRLSVQRRQNQTLVDRLYLALTENPRLTPEDRSRYNMDEEQLNRMTSRLADDDREIARLLESSVKTTQELAAPSAGQPAENGSGGPSPSTPDPASASAAASPAPIEPSPDDIVVPPRL